ncbi:MAG: hypothetical protein HKP24_10415 [Croceitalea sp.]|nr:hypothetical protein [Croceitalea sp.]
MYIEKDSKVPPLLADMHYDGVRFDPRILEALKKQRATHIADNHTNG